MEKNIAEKNTGNLSERKAKKDIKTPQSGGSAYVTALSGERF